MLTRRDLVGRAAGLVAASSGGGLLLAACGSSGEEKGGGAGRELTFLTITPISLSFTAEIIADAGGHFRDQGLDVTIQATRGSSQAVQLVLTGRALLSRLGNIESILAIAKQGAPLVNVGALLQGDTLRFVSAKDEPLRKPADFRGKKMGIPSEGGTSETTLDLVLAAENVPLDSVERQVVGLTPAVFQLVEQGRIDGYVVGVEAAVTLQEREPNAVVFDPASVITAGQSYFTSRDSLGDAEMKDTVRRYLAAIRSAVDFVLEDLSSLDETLEVMRREYDFPALQNEAVAKESIREVAKTWVAAGERNVLRTVEKRFSTVYQQLVDVKLVKAGLDPSDWFTNELVPRGRS